MNSPILISRTALVAAAMSCFLVPLSPALAGQLPDTGQSGCYDSGGSATACPSAGERFYGQDAQHQGNALSYTDNGDGTVTDNVTGIIWQQSPDLNNDGVIDVDDKLSFTEAGTYCENLTLAGYSDWTLPSVTQTYSLIHFDGEDASSYTGSDTSALVPFIDTDYFEFGYGDLAAGERLIDAQFASSTSYVSTTMNGDDTMFGVNFADGRIKGYPKMMGSTEKLFYVYCARNLGDYGETNFTENGDSTITDSNTGLMWSQDDSGLGMNWEDALAWAEQKNAVNYLGYNDWRLPNIKELQSLVDYTRSPDTINSAAIDPLFNSTPIVNEAGEIDYPYYWSSTTHISYGPVPGGNGAYVSFGRAMGSMDGGNTWLDVHGAGSQRSDPKDGNASDYPKSHGPQGDAQRVFNYVRLVRDVDTSTGNSGYLTNISTRAYLAGGVNDAFAGFVVSGDGSMQVMLRGMAVEDGVDPRLDLYQRNNSGTWDFLASNDEWETAINATEVSALPQSLQLTDRNQNDAGILIDLQPGVYSLVLSSNGEAGQGVVGVDATDTTSNNPRLTNISTRAYVAEGVNNAFAGFVVTGGSLQVMLRGMANDPGTNPTLNLLNLQNKVWTSLASNDEWENDANADAVRALASNLQLADVNDAGLLTTLEAGVYTAQLGSSDQPGKAVVGVDAVE